MNEPNYSSNIMEYVNPPEKSQICTRVIFALLLFIIWMVLGYTSKIWPLIALGIIVPALVVFISLYKQYVIRPRSIIINDFGLELHYLTGKTKSVTWSDFEYIILYTGKRRYQGMKATAADLHLVGKDVPVFLTLEIGRVVMRAYLKATGVPLKYNELS